MRLAILLFLLKVKLVRAAREKPAFLNKLKQRDYTLVIRTADRRHGRYFTFAKGAVFSGNGMHARPDVELVWVSVPVAFKALASGDDKQVMTALGKSQLSIQGNLDHFFWFAEVMEAMTAG